MEADTTTTGDDDMTTTTETTTTEERTFKIPAVNLGELDKRVKALGRRAEKLGVQKPLYRVVKEFDDTRVKHYGDDAVGRPITKEYKIRMAEIEVMGPVVQAEGWDFIAAVEHTPAGNAINATPGGREIEIPTRYREGDALCEHCNTRRNRKASFICHSESAGEVPNMFKQVGRNCLADFLGRDPASLVWGLSAWEKIAGCEIFDEDMYFSGGGKSAPWSFSFVEFMTAVLHFVRTEGWLSRGNAHYRDDAVATADLAWDAITPAFDSKEEARKAAIRAKFKDSDKAKAKAAIDWTFENLSAMRFDDRTDFEQNLYIALSKCGVEHKNSGIVASLVVGYNRHLEAEINRNEQATKSNEYLWTEGERVKNVSLTLVKQRSFEGDFGARVLHHFEDEVGNLVIWWGGDFFAGAEVDSEADLGDTCTASWTVKTHETYKGRNQTVVYRPAKKAVTKKA